MLLLGGIFAVVAGRLCDRFGRKTTLMVGLVGSALTGLVFRTADPWGLSFLLLAMGAASGPWSTAGQSILITAVTPARLGLGGALYFLSNTLGNALGSFCTGLVKTTYSFAQIGAVMCIGMVAVIVLAFALLPGDAPSPTTAQTARLNTWTAYRPLLGRGNVYLLLSLRLTITTFWGMATLALPLLIYRVGESESLPAVFCRCFAGRCRLLPTRRRLSQRSPRPHPTAPRLGVRRLSQRLGTGLVARFPRRSLCLRHRPHRYGVGCLDADSPAHQRCCRPRRKKPPRRLGPLCLERLDGGRQLARRLLDRDQCRPTLLSRHGPYGARCARCLWPLPPSGRRGGYGLD